MHGHINRFSEDVDLIALRKEGETDNKLKSKLKKISKVISDLLPEVEVADVTRKMGMTRKTAHSYAKEFDGNYGQVRDVIIVEETWLGYFEPYTILPISSFIYDMMINNGQSTLAQEYGLHPFEAKVLVTSRTFCEKIMSLVRFSYTSDPVNDLKKKIRHAYDLHQLLQDSEIEAFFKSSRFDQMLLRVAEYDAKLLQQKERTNQNQLQSDIRFRQAQMEYTMEYSRIASAAIDLVGKKGGELTAFQKILALAQIGIDTGAAIMKAELVALQAATAGGPAAPFIYKATKLSIIGSILTAAARAKDLFSNSDVPDFGSSSPESQERGRPGRASAPEPRKSFYYRGPTGDGLGFGDQYGEYAGYVHRHEYVIPQAVRQEPIVQMQIEPILEALRMRSFSGRSFYQGGETSPSPTSSTSQSPVAGSTRTDQLLETLIQEVRQWPREVKGKWVITDLEEAQEEKNYLEKRYKA